MTLLLLELQYVQNMFCHMVYLGSGWCTRHDSACASGESKKLTPFRLKKALGDAAVSHC